MSRSVADLVLVRDDFAVVPAMVAEGRQILRNIQRVARLFVTSDPGLRKRAPSRPGQWSYAGSPS